jgi:hypothetical protein
MGETPREAFCEVKKRKVLGVVVEKREKRLGDKLSQERR